MYISYIATSDGVNARMHDGSIYFLPYDKTIEERLIYANRMIYLQNRFLEDNERLEYLIKTRKMNIKSYWKVSAILATAAVGISGLFCLADLRSGVESYPLAFGRQSVLETHLKVTLPCLFLGTQPGSLSFLVHLPSKSEIEGFTEVVRYEKDTLKGMSTQYIYDVRKEECNEVDTNKHILSFDNEMKKLKEDINLRYFYGTCKEQVLRMYINGSLLNYFDTHPYYSDEAIAHFMNFLGEEVTKLENDPKKSRSLKKSLV